MVLTTMEDEQHHRQQQQQVMMEELPHQETNKRQKTTTTKTTCKFWTEASNYIATNGGSISPSLEFNESNRTVILTSSVSKGDILMHIPSTALLSLKTVETSPFGTTVFQIVHRVDNYNDNDNDNDHDHDHTTTDSNTTKTKLFHSKSDLVLALFLASVSSSISSSISSSSSSSSNSNSSSIPSELEGVQKYLATLPSNHSFNNLPRRWPEEILHALLKGTSVLDRALLEKRGLENDYQLLQESYSNTKQEKKDAAQSQSQSQSNAFQFQFQFPTWDKFDQMMAAVASRAFQSLGPDNLDCMIPLLDCINHKRGIGVGFTSDVTYQKLLPDTNTGTGPDADTDTNTNTDTDTENHTPCNGSDILLKAKHDLPKGYVPGITYGAKGNAQLLCRYGFTLEDNVEPDGSSNDVVEIMVHGSKCDLRAGPKSYTYGCLVKAMGLVGASETVGGDGDGGGGACGMDDFLNACEAEEEEFDGMYGDGDGAENEDEDDEDEDEGLGTEIQGLQSLINDIQEAEKQYSLSGDSLKDAWGSPADSRERFSAILVTSEKRTLQLYVDAIHLILSKLKGCEIEIQSESKATNAGASTDSSKLLQLQTFAMELRDAYIAIRHPDLSY